MRQDLTGQLVVVTGASSGVGYALTRHLVQEEGATVIAVARRRVFRLEALARQLGDDRLFSLTADLSLPGEARRVAEHVRETWGRPVAFVHAICRTLRAPSLEVTDTEFDLTMQVNVKSALYSVQAFGPMLRESGHGAIVIYNPDPLYTDGFTGSEAVASAAFSALSALTEGWARQYGDARIVVREVNHMLEDEQSYDGDSRACHDVMVAEELKDALDESDALQPFPPVASTPPLPVPEPGGMERDAEPVCQPLILSTRGGLALAEFS